MPSYGGKQYTWMWWWSKNPDWYLASVIKLICTFQTSSSAVTSAFHAGKLVRVRMSCILHFFAFLNTMSLYCLGTVPQKGFDSYKQNLYNFIKKKKKDRKKIAIKLRQKKFKNSPMTRRYSDVLKRTYLKYLTVERLNFQKQQMWGRDYGVHLKIMMQYQRQSVPNWSYGDVPLCQVVRSPF